MKKTMLSTKQSYLVCFIGVLAAFGVVMALCESGLADSYIKGIMMTACIAIIMTTSLNLTIGVLGQLTLGCCGFEAIGAYVAALASKYMVAAGIGVDPTTRFLITTLLGGIVACVFGILIGIPALRLHGDYLAIITLGFGEIIRVIIQNLKVAGGMGLDKGAAGQALIGIDRTANLYVVFWIMVVTVVVLFMFGRSRYGRAVKAIRDDEIAAEAMGINLARNKMISFVVSSFFCGVAGAMLAMCNTSVSSVSFTTSMTYQILLVVVVGGIGSVSGSVIAAFIYYASSEWWLRFLDLETYTASGARVPLLGYGFRMVVFSVLIMIVVLFFRKGIMGTREVSVYDDIRKIGRFFTRKSAAKGGDAQ